MIAVHRSGRLRVVAVTLACLAALAPFHASALAGRVTGFVAVTDGSGSMQISAFDLAGGHERALTAGPADHHYPTLSSDGRTLLYVGDDGGGDEVYSLDLTSSHPAPQQVTAPPLLSESPAWALDGRSIAYSAILKGWTAYQIFVARPDGNRPVQITHDQQSGSSQPAFSPDGTRIAYINGHARDDRIWVMDADGANARPLTSGPLDAYPTWLDSHTVLFAREDPAAHRSAVIGVDVATGDLTPLSPPTVSVVEPRPMPDRRSYGATAQLDGALHLVTITRTDGLPLTAASRAEFAVSPIDIAARDGSVFTMSWIVSEPRAAAKTSWTPFVVATIGAAMIAVAAVAAYRRRLYKNERLLV
jgi:hypothetical protein